MTESFFDFFFYINTARFNQSHDRFLIIAVKEIVDDLGSSCVPVEDDGVIGQIKPSIACVRIFDKIVENVCKITDNRSCKGYHADDDNRQAGQGQGNARGADILYDRLNTSRIKNHSHRIISGMEKFIFSVPRRERELITAAETAIKSTLNKIIKTNTTRLGCFATWTLSHLLNLIIQTSCNGM